jgi:hypothetical protein
VFCFGLFAEELEGFGEGVHGECEAEDRDGERDDPVGVEGAGHAVGGEGVG